MMARRYLLGTTRNMRDLGGYPTEDGRVTAFGRLIRSDVPLGLEKKDKKILLDNKMDTVIDLREERERARVRSSLENARGFSVYHCPLSYPTKIHSLEGKIPGSYLKLIDEKQSVARALSLMADAPNGVLFHCTAGKDRTGILSSLLLSFVGVPLADILADYQVSYTYSREFIREMHKAHPDWPMFAGMSKMEYMEQFHDMFVRKYGSVEQYFNEIGLTQLQKKSLKAKLLYK